MKANLPSPWPSTLRKGRGNLPASQLANRVAMGFSIGAPRRLHSPSVGERISRAKVRALNPRTTGCLLSRPAATLSSIRNGGEGRGEEALRFMGRVGVRGQPRLATLLFLYLLTRLYCCAASDLQISVYCTAGEVQQILATPDGKERVLRAVQPLKVSRLFLEGRRGDEYVPPAQLRELRDFFAAKGIQCSGGIATVPGEKFGVRQTGGLAWLNWESPKTAGRRCGILQSERAGLRPDHRG